MNTLPAMQVSIQSLDISTRRISASTDQMRLSVMGLNQGINHAMTPMHTMTNMMPFRW